MTLPWYKAFRIDTTSPMLFALEERVGEAALAHLHKLYAALPDDVAVTGDLSAITDTAIERWAQWKGAARELAHALRDTGWITPEGHLWKWRERQEASIVKAARDAARPAGRNRPARDKRGNASGTSAGTRAGQARGDSAFERDGVDVEGPSRAGQAREPARDKRGPLSNLISSDQENLEKRESRAGQARDNLSDEERAERIGDLAAQIAHELKEPLPPTDVHSPAFLAWVGAHGNIMEEARRVVDEEAR